MNYQLQPAKLIATTEQLSLRVSERLPDSGLSRVVADLVPVARQAVQVADSLVPANIPVRIFVGLLAMGLAGLAMVASASLRMPAGEASAIDVAQGIEATINILVFGGAAIYFVWSIETRLKRRRVLSLVAQLRSLAHVIDMHQISKTPDRIETTLRPTEHSPPRLQLTPDLLVRYLDYCSEALSLLSKLAALQVEEFDDPVTLEAVNDLETLTTGFSRKIWQKIMIIRRA
ncbi:hypothetical protein [Humisphaera borealis]|uniref:Uncharacterized protein n=1 Tax=Humisphaera borealis TaxID=2807512 RepID=A0A7M2X4P9_9BACT|nr:hypothetical protein [Humisphaera borealis]QOV91750.1 hypothetical protein IPV69_10480 [Humisphaera borealis]